MIRLQKLVCFLLMFMIIFQMSSCKTSQPLVASTQQDIDPLILSGGSSGMEQLDDQSLSLIHI